MRNQELGAGSGEQKLPASRGVGADQAKTPRFARRAREKADTTSPDGQLFKAYYF